MLSKHVAKIVQNLEKKKFREKYNLFKVEGEKLVKELLLSDFKIRSVFAYKGWKEATPLPEGTYDITEVDEKEMGVFAEHVASLNRMESLVSVAAEAFQLLDLPTELIVQIYNNFW